MATPSIESSRGERAVGLITGFILCFLTILLLDRYAFHHSWRNSATDGLVLGLIYVVANAVGSAIGHHRDRPRRQG